VIQASYILEIKCTETPNTGSRTLTKDHRWSKLETRGMKISPATRALCRELFTSITRRAGRCERREMHSDQHRGCYSWLDWSEKSPTNRINFSSSFVTRDKRGLHISSQRKIFMIVEGQRRTGDASYWSFGNFFAIAIIKFTAL
jgi:hypothetical protein